MELKCDNAQLWISCKVDGESIPGDVEGLLERHLESCARCRAILESETRRSAVLGALLRGDPSEEEELEAALVEAIGKHRASEPLPAAAGASPQRFWISPAWQWSLAGIAAAALFALVIWALWAEKRAPGPVASPSGPSRESEGVTVLKSPLWISFEDEWVDGPPEREEGGWRVRWVRRVRDIVLESLEPGPRHSPGVRDLILDTERVDSEYVRFADWKYH